MFVASREGVCWAVSNCWIVRVLRVLCPVHVPPPEDSL